MLSHKLSSLSLILLFAVGAKRSTDYREVASFPGSPCLGTRLMERGVECVPVSSLSLYWRHGMHCGFNPKCALWQPLEVLHSTTQVLWELIHEAFGKLPPFLDAVHHMFTTHVLNMCCTGIVHVLYRYCTCAIQVLYMCCTGIVHATLKSKRVWMCTTNLQEEILFWWDQRQRHAYCGWALWEGLSLRRKMTRNQGKIREVGIQHSPFLPTFPLQGENKGSGKNKRSGNAVGSLLYFPPFLPTFPSHFFSPRRRQGTRERWRRGVHGTSPLLYCSFSSRQHHTNHG